MLIVFDVDSQKRRYSSSADFDYSKSGQEIVELGSWYIIPYMYLAVAIPVVFVFKILLEVLVPSRR